jgi:WD40 repeat protein
MSDSRLDRDKKIAVRVVHTRLTKLKLFFARDSEEFRIDYDELLQELYALLLPYAHEWVTYQPWSPGTSEILAEAEDLAERAANIGATRITRCSAYFVSLGIQERGLFWSWFRDAERGMPEIDRDHEGELESKKEKTTYQRWVAEAKEDHASVMNSGRVTLLVRLLRISRRSLTYMAVHEARDSTHGHVGRLSDCYLGTTANGGTRQARLVPLRIEWEQVCDELAQVLQGGDEDDVSHTIAPFIRGLDSLSSGPGQSETATVLGDLLRQGAIGFRSTRFPTLARALQRAADRFAGISGQNPSLVCSATDELGSEIDDPGTRLPSAKAIHSLLQLLERDINLERDPQDVLACIANKPILVRQTRPLIHPPPGRQPGGADMPDDVVHEWVRLVLTLAQFDRDDPAWDIIVNLGIGYGLGDFALRLANYLSGPDQLEPSLLNEILVVLKDWMDELSRGPYSDDEVETRLRQTILIEMETFRTHVDHIREAIELVQGWLDKDAQPPSSWADLPEGVKEILQTALLIVLIGRIHKALYRLYRANQRYQGQALDAADLVESILGPDHVDPSRHAGSSEVRDRLVAKAVDKWVHVMTIAALSEDKFVTGDTTGAVNLWQAQPGGSLRLAASHRQGRTVFALQVFPSGIVAAARDDGTVTLWDPVKDPDAQDLRVLEDHEGFVLALARLGDRYLISGDQSGQVVLWDTTTGTREEILKAHIGPARAIATRGSSEVFSGGQDGSIQAWDIVRGSIAPVGEHRTGVLTVVAYPDDILLTGGHEGAVRVWDITTWTDPYGPGVKLLSSFPFERAVTVLAAKDRTIISANGHVVVRLDSSGTVAGELMRHEDIVRDAVIGDSEVFSCGKDGCIRVAQINGGESVLIEHAAPIRCLTAFPAGGTFVVAAGSEDGIVFVRTTDGRSPSASSPSRV